MEMVWRSVIEHDFFASCMGLSYEIVLNWYCAHRRSHSLTKWSFMALVTNRWAYARRPKVLSNLIHVHVPCCCGEERGGSSPFCSMNERMVFSKFQRQDTISQVVPVNDNLASADLTDDLHKEQCWDARGILSRFLSISANLERLSYLNQDEFWRDPNQNDKNDENGHNLVYDLDRCRQNERQPSYNGRQSG